MIDLKAISEVVATLLNYPEGYAFSPYEIHKVINKIYLQVGWTEIRPQMMYNYSTNGGIVHGVRKGPNGDHKYTKTQVQTFITKLITNKIARMSNI